MKKILITIILFCVTTSYAQQSQPEQITKSTSEYGKYTTEVNEKPARILTVLGNVVVYAIKESSSASWEMIYVYNGYECCPVKVIYKDSGISMMMEVTILKGQNIGPLESDQEKSIAFDDLSKTIWIQ